MLERHRNASIQILALKRFVDLVSREFPAGRVSEVVDDLPDLLVHELRQLVAELLLEDVRDAAFARLTVDSDDRFVAPSDIRGINRNIENVPRLAGLLCGPRFVDGVLM